MCKTVLACADTFLSLSPCVIPWNGFPAKVYELDWHNCASCGQHRREAFALRQNDAGIKNPIQTSKTQDAPAPRRPEIESESAY